MITTYQCHYNTRSDLHSHAFFSVPSEQVDYYCEVRKAFQTQHSVFRSAATPAATDTCSARFSAQAASGCRTAGSPSRQACVTASLTDNASTTLTYATTLSVPL